MIKNNCSSHPWDSDLAWLQNLHRDGVLHWPPQGLGDPSLVTCGISGVHIGSPYILGECIRIYREDRGALLARGRLVLISWLWQVRKELCQCDTKFVRPAFFWVVRLRVFMSHLDWEKRWIIWCWGSLFLRQTLFGGGSLKSGGSETRNVVCSFLFFFPDCWKLTSVVEIYFAENGWIVQDV